MIKKYIPKKLLLLKIYFQNTIKLMGGYGYDSIRYLKYSGTSQISSKAQLIGKITAQYHVVEKGLAMKNMRFSFGMNKIRDLISNIEIYNRTYKRESDTQVITAVNVLRKYVEVHEKLGQVNSEIYGIKEKVSKFDCTKNNAGVERLTKQDVIDSINFDYAKFVKNRRSIRSFTKQEVCISKLYKAIENSKYYPSVCNRQSGRLKIVSDKKMIKKIGELQGGCKGFLEEIDKMIIVMSDLSVFSNDNERNQVFIDGGIFLHSLLLSLHSEGLGAVALNWSASVSKDKCLRGMIEINGSDSIISMIGVGNIPEEVLVPASIRLGLKEILC